MAVGKRRSVAYLVAAAAAAAQWPLQRALGVAWPHPVVPVFAGLSILGAAFLLSWAAEAAEHDIPSGLAVAALAVVAVLPEYAVDIYFAWRGGREPAYTAFATANMTGANRLLIGAGWGAVLLAGWLGKRKTEVAVEPSLSTDLFVLALATFYAFLIPLKGTLSLLDFAAFSGIFLFFVFGLGGDRAEPELEGPAELLGSLEKSPRRIAVAALFLFSAASIFLSAGPFAEGLVEVGRHYGVDQFLLVQWVAPLASEAPEFLIAALFAFKGRSGTGLRVLISSKVNQWTLLVGMLPAVFCLSARSFSPMALDSQQRHEILLTAAQSFFGLTVLLDLRFGWKEALALAALFLPQPFFTSPHARGAFSGLYLAGGVAAFFKNGGIEKAGAVARRALRRG